VVRPASPPPMTMISGFSILSLKSAAEDIDDIEFT
ncbi:MAG: hypothetical protein K0S84_849, partial [Nitrososphaera sp.]|nr:hypothetical protein [Nitrososphaera sp.]